MDKAALRALALLEGHALRRKGEGLSASPPLSPAQVEALRPFKAGLLAALDDGERVAGEELLANPYRLAAFLLGLYPPPEGLLEITAFFPERTERVLAPNPLPALRWHARNQPAPRGLRLSRPGSGWSLEVGLTPGEQGGLLAPRGRAEVESGSGQSLRPAEGKAS